MIEKDIIPLSQDGENTFVSCLLSYCHTLGVNVFCCLSCLSATITICKKQKRMKKFSTIYQQ